MKRADISKETINEIIEKSVNELRNSLNKEKSLDELSMTDIANYIVKKIDRNHPGEYLNSKDFFRVIKLSHLDLGYQDNPALKSRVVKMFNYLLENKIFYYVKSEDGYSTIPF